MDVRIPRELRNLTLKSTDRRKHMKRIVLGVILLISSMALFLPEHAERNKAMEIGRASCRERVFMMV